MVDLHTHLLPGVDDGARSADEARETLARLAADGVTCVVCTPHLRASEAATAPAERNAALLAGLRELAPQGPELRLGFEIMLDRPGVDLTAPALRLGGAAAVLVEFAHSGVPPRSARELGRLRESGVVPVVAHPERYWGASVAHVREWRAAGAVMQGDATFLLGGGPRGALARALLAEGLVDLLASDNHGDARSLRPARDWLVEIGAAEQAAQLTARNAAHLLAGEPLEPVPPVVVESGMLHRLRDLLLGRA
jgi:protein-tyrosine phosphatase